MAEILTGYPYAVAHLRDPQLTWLEAEANERERVEMASLRLAAIVESSDDAIIGKTLEGTIVDWNGAAQRLYGYTATEVIGRPISLLIPRDRPDELPAIMEQLKRGERIEHYETERVTKHGQRISVSVTISPIRNAAGRLVGASAIARDISERRQADRERELLRTRELQASVEARDAAQRLAAQSELVARLEERERIAMDLHDGAIQSLYGVVLGLGARQFAGEASGEDLSKAIDRINTVIQEIRNYVLNPRLDDLETGGLRAGIEALAEEVRINTLIRPRVEFIGNHDGLNPVVTKHVLQLLREATSNVIRHAQATRVMIQVANADSRLVVRVRDNGSGFDRRSGAWRPGNGLLNIVERAHLIGGHASILSRPGRGTNVRVWFPIRTV